MRKQPLRPVAGSPCAPSGKLCLLASRHESRLEEISLFFTPTPQAFGVRPEPFHLAKLVGDFLEITRLEQRLNVAHLPAALTSQRCSTVEYEAHNQVGIVTASNTAKAASQGMTRCRTCGSTSLASVPLRPETPTSAASVLESKCGAQARAVSVADACPKSQPTPIVTPDCSPGHSGFLS